MDLKSQSFGQIVKDAYNGASIFELIADNGHNDVLTGASREEVLRDVLYHHDLNGLPESWELREITLEEFEGRYS